MTLLEILDLLEGYGLIVTDEDELRRRIAHLVAKGLIEPAYGVADIEAP